MNRANRWLAVVCTLFRIIGVQPKTSPAGPKAMRVHRQGDGMDTPGGDRILVLMNHDDQPVLKTKRSLNDIMNFAPGGEGIPGFPVCSSCRVICLNLTVYHAQIFA